MKGKIYLAKNVIENNINLFRCPICKEQMCLNSNSLQCLKKHCFDLSKNGYVNLLTSPVHSKYNRSLFVSRRIIFQNDFFQGLIEKIGELILQEINTKKLTGIKVLDAGCGEGSNLAGISTYIKRKVNIDFTGVGIDISKEGIHIAAREYPGYIWCVADLADIPMRDGQCDIILNILSPSNYIEFNRILIENGLLIKVIPGNLYLKEIREVLNQQKEKKKYSNEEVIKLFQSKFKKISKKQLFYQQLIEREYIFPLVEMTPLSWGLKEDDFRKQQILKINKITVDLTILVGVTK